MVHHKTTSQSAARRAGQSAACALALLIAINAGVCAPVFAQDATSASDSLQPAAQAGTSSAASKIERDDTNADGSANGSGGLTLDTFLDRLMMAESGGRLRARNPRSTALGPFQFIASTWLMIANKYFIKETKDLRAGQVLALRIDPALARRAAEIYTHQNAAYLIAKGQKATFANLRLAFLVGPGAAVRVLSAPTETPAGTLLGGAVINANPFMAKLTAEGLIARAARDVATTSQAVAGVVPDPALVKQAVLDPVFAAAAKGPRIAVLCSLSLPSCRRWLALAERRVSKKQRRASR